MDAIYRVRCFLKSQKKRSPSVFDEKMFHLWMQWQSTYSGQTFDKFRGMFCAICRFIHKYEIAGRISEESNEALNSTHTDIKTRLRTMPTTTTCIEVTNACT